MSLENLPKTNDRREKRNQMELILESKFLEMIKNFEKQNEFKFKSYEIDCMFSSLMKKNHEGYFRTKIK